MSEWLLRPRPVDRPRVRLFCLPHAGAGASVFVPWARELPADLDVCGVQLPGRENRIATPLARRMGPLVDALARAIGPRLDVPYAIFGHSMGATVGFELARALRRLGAPAPVRLIVAGRRGPHMPAPQPWRHTLSGPAFVAELKRLGGTPPALLAEPELLELFAAILRADFEVLETHTWVAGEPLACPISILHGEADAEVTAEEMATWSGHTRAGARFDVFSGDHFFPHQQRPAVLRCIDAALSRASDSSE